MEGEEIAVDDDMNSDSCSNKEAGEGENEEGNPEKTAEEKSEHTAENDSDGMDVSPTAENSGETIRNYGEDFATTSKSRMGIRRRKNYGNTRRSILPRKSKTKAMESINNLAKTFQGMAKKGPARKRRGVVSRSKKSNMKNKMTKAAQKPKKYQRRQTRSTLRMKSSGLSLLSSGSSSFDTSITQSDLCSHCRYCIGN